MKTRTGLSRRNGGRWLGSFVYRFTGTSRNVLGFIIPGSDNIITTLPSSCVVENDFGAGC